MKTSEKLYQGKLRNWMHLWLIFFLDFSAIFQLFCV